MSIAAICEALEFDYEPGSGENVKTKLDFHDPALGLVFDSYNLPSPCGGRDPAGQLPEESTSLAGATEAKLETLQARVQACERHLAASTVQSTALLRVALDAMRDALRRLVGTMPRTRSADPSVRNFRADAEALERALTVGLAIRPNAIEARRTRIERAATAVYAELLEAHAAAGGRIDGPTLRVLRRYQHVGEALDAELRIAAACRRLLAGCRGRALVERRSELAVHLEALRRQLDERRAELAEQRQRSATLWRVLDAGLRADIENISTALECLLHSRAS